MNIKMTPLRSRLQMWKTSEEGSTLPRKEIADWLRILARYKTIH